jgi:hypothetical protein
MEVGVALHDACNDGSRIDYGGQPLALPGCTAR